MTDTPRTDNVCEHNYTDGIIRFTKELERETVRLINEREQYRADYELADRCFRNCQRELARAQNEVAAWREKPMAQQLREQSKDIARLRAELARVTKERDESLKALRDLMPFVLDDYYPNCATPDYKSAVEAAKKVCNEP